MSRIVLNFFKRSYSQHAKPKPGVRRIALEEAFVTPDIYHEWAKVLDSRFAEPGFKLMGKGILGDSPGAKAVHARLLDLDAGRIQHMDETGIDLQLISITSPGVQVFDAITARHLSAQANDALAEAVRRHPSRFAGLATVAPQHPASAAKELERAVRTLGMRGSLINSHTFGEYLDDRKYWPILEASEALGAPIYLHPREPPASMIGPFEDHGLYFATWGFAAETGLHAMRLILGGVFDHFPRLKIILGHMGEGIPFWLQRIDNRYQLGVKIGANQPLKRLPSEYFKDNFLITTSGVTHNGALRLCIDELGVDKIMFAADYPYESVEEHVSFMDAAPITAEERLAIYSKNAERVFRF